MAKAQLKQYNGQVEEESMGPAQSQGDILDNYPEESGPRVSGEMGENPFEGSEDVMPGMGNLFDVMTARSSEGPRSLSSQHRATPSRPSVPTPMAGTQSPASTGLMGFEPMAGPPSQSMVVPGASLRSAGLLGGGSSGLTGGGLGTPFDPTTNEQSDPIEGLIELLMRGQNGI